MAEHVDRTRLNTDLRYRFDYLSKFLNFTNNDIIILNSLVPILLPHIPSIAETIYNKLQSFHMEKEVFGSHDSNGTSEKNSNISNFLLVYLQRTLSQTEWNEEFLQYLSDIGELSLHENDGQSIQMDYTHINMFLAYLEHLLINTIWTSEQMDMRTKQSAIKAMNKFIWIQNNFIAMHHEYAMKKDINGRLSH